MRKLIADLLLKVECWVAKQRKARQQRQQRHWAIERLREDIGGMVVLWAFVYIIHKLLVSLAG